jgi:hypothetical protein
MHAGAQRAKLTMITLLKSCSRYDTVCRLCHMQAIV